jgi:hypothetical protein
VERARILDTISFDNSRGLLHTGSLPLTASQSSEVATTEEQTLGGEQDNSGRQDVIQASALPPGAETVDVSPFYSVDEMGNLDSFGPSSALQSSIKTQAPTGSLVSEHIRNSLIANAVLQRQREHELYSLPDIDGVPIELAMHLLDLHWNRQHHTFLLTYRPAIMRDLRQGGRHCSIFLVNSIFACTSKYSHRIDLRDDAANPTTTGARFFRRCDELLSRDSLLIVPSMPTIIGLLLLGSTYNARGETSKGWLYTGYALRMIYDLGLHLDLRETNDNAEEVEIRRRVFWGAFICDKLQSLYLGRPVAIQIHDAHVSRNFIDIIEENELWKPYDSPTMADSLGSSLNVSAPATPIHSVSTFQHLCLLSLIMTQIINNFYVVGATATTASASLQTIDDSLDAWNRDLPIKLVYDASQQRIQQRTPPPNVLHLHGIYHSLVILLHRPLLSDGHLRSAVAPASSWRRCTVAARNITNIALAYQSTYTLRGGPNLLAYALYVACTIHVRNAAAVEVNQGGENSSMLMSSLRCLDELTMPNPGVARQTSIIRKLISASGLNLVMLEKNKSTPPTWRDLDVDAIVRLFPSRPPDSNGFTQTQVRGQSYGVDDPLYQDLLYGFMDGPSNQSYDLEPPMFDLNFST